MNSYLFWVVGSIWFTVPILSWLWCLASVHYYRKAISSIRDATVALEQARTLNEQMVNYRLETLEIRTKAEEEIKLACRYYAKVTDILSSKEKECITQ